MPTLTTQVLSATGQRFDRLAIAVNLKDMNPDGAKPKSGIVLVTVTNVTFSHTANGLSTGNDKYYLDLRSPRYDALAETPLIDRLALSGAASAHTPTITKHATAINLGVPGPSAFVQGDGAADVLHLCLQLDPANEKTDTLTATITYTVTFTEHTPDSSAGAYLDLAVRPGTDADYGEVITGALSGCNVVKLTFVSLDTVLEDNPQIAGLHADYPAGRTDRHGDSVPELLCYNLARPSGGQQFVLCQHAVSKSSSASLTYSHMQRVLVYAVNDGKIDNNGRRQFQTFTAVPAQAGQYHLAGVTLRRRRDWPCDDAVTATVRLSVSAGAL